MTTWLPPDDEKARNRITQELDITLFVEAGAGSGKTTALVDRVVALVASGAVELAHLAAITFTEKAGAELRHRVRRSLQEAAADTAQPERAERCRRALAQLDGTAIGTLHSFAQRILTQHAVEAELPPGVEVLDEVSSSVAFDRRWERVLDDLLSDAVLERTLLLLTAARVDPKKLRALAVAFDASWGLVEQRVSEAAPEPPAVSLAEVEPLVAELEACCRDCHDPAGDRLVGRIVDFRRFVDALSALDDELAVIELLSDDKARPSAKVGRSGNQRHWNCPVDDVRAKVVELGVALDGICAGVLRACAHRLGAALRHHTLAAARERQAVGQLEFHDLLVLARKVLTHPVQGPVVRRSLHQRYRRLLLDEFQDTDPIQIELAVRIAAPDPTRADRGRWADVDVGPGRLFFVGDPKQSIYRFRRADITTFLEAKDRFGPEAGGPVELTTNFRTTAPILRWVNATFSALMAEAPDVDVPSQPSYVDLDAARSVPAPTGPPVAVVGVEAHPKGTRADDMRAAEARDVAHAVATAMTDGWQVRDDAGDGWRDARLGDVTILIPARTSLPFLEDALDAAAIAFRTESSSLVYASRAVRDLLMVLRAVDDPTDHLRVVAALRTPLLGCGGDDLFRHKVVSGRSWSYLSPELADATGAGDGPVVAGLAFLADLHQDRHWRSPAELLDRIARERRAFELGFADGRPRDVWRRLRFVIDQARAWSEATGGGLRAYLAWVDQQSAEGSRVAGAILPETDDDAVRIMTVHAAKGLQFPVTVLSGSSTRPQTTRNAVDVVFPRDGAPVGYRIGKEVVTEEFEAWKPIDEQMGYDERVRLLYVACTRACDHLVVSLHRTDRKDPDKAASRTNAEVLLAGMGDLIGDLADLGGRAERRAANPDDLPAPPPSYEAWEAERAEAIAVAARPRAVAATALTDEGGPDVAVEPGGAAEAGLQKRPRDLDLPPWLKGRYGTAVGRAVHGVLQVVDLATGAGVDAAVSSQCQAEAIPERVTDVRRLVEAALASPVVRAAAARAHWREVYACTPVADRLLEGYVDLLYRGDAGLVVVDYKTSATADAGGLGRRVAGYRLQGAAYAVAVGRATGEAVASVTFLFLTPTGAVERSLDGLPTAMADVERLVASGTEAVLA